MTTELTVCKLEEKVSHIKDYARSNSIDFTIEYSSDLNIYQPGQHEDGRIIVLKDLNQIQILQIEAHELFHAILDQHNHIPVFNLSDKIVAHMATLYDSDEYNKLDEMFSDNINNLLHHSIMISDLYPKFDIPLCFYKDVLRLNFNKHIATISKSADELYSFVDGVYFTDILNTLNDPVMTDTFLTSGNSKHVETFNNLSHFFKTVDIGTETQQLQLDLNFCVESLVLGQKPITCV